MIYYGLKKYRARYGLSQDDMAEILGTSTSNYNRKENGKVKFTLDEAKAIADLFGESIEIIFFKA